MKMKSFKQFLKELHMVVPADDYIPMRKPVNPYWGPNSPIQPTAPRPEFEPNDGDDDDSDPYDYIPEDWPYDWYDNILKNLLRKLLGKRFDNELNFNDLLTLLLRLLNGFYGDVPQWAIDRLLAFLQDLVDNGVDFPGSEHLTEYQRWLILQRILFLICVLNGTCSGEEGWYDGQEQDLWHYGNLHVTWTCDSDGCRWVDDDGNTWDPHFGRLYGPNGTYAEYVWDEDTNTGTWVWYDEDGNPL